jgi:hypothetical protein
VVTETRLSQFERCFDGVVTLQLAGYEHLANLAARWRMLLGAGEVQKRLAAARVGATDAIFLDQRDASGDARVETLF